MSFFKKSLVAFVVVGLVVGTFFIPINGNVLAKSSIVISSGAIPTPHPAPIPAPIASPAISISSIHVSGISLKLPTNFIKHNLTSALSLTVTGITFSGKTYDGTDTATFDASGAQLVGVVPPDVVTLNTAGATATFSDKNVGVGKTVTISGLTLGGADAGNYSLTQPTGTADITTLPITVTAVTDSKTYDGTPSSSGIPTITLGSLAAGDSATWTQTLDTATEGTNKTLTSTGTVNDGNGGNNYSITFNTNSTGVISQATPTISWSNPSDITYGTALSAAQLDATASVPGTFAYTPALGTVLNAGVNQTLSVVFTPTDVTDYTTASANVLINVLAEPITITVNVGQTKVYGTSDPAFTYISSDPLVVFTGALNRVAGENVGIYTIDQGTLNASANYAITFVPANFSVTKRPITVTASTDTKIYDGTTSSSAVPTIILGSLAGTDTVVWTETFNDKTVGVNKPLTPAGIVNDGNGGNNYMVTFVPNNTGIITPAVLTVSATGINKVYDGTVNATVNLSDNRIAGDVLTTGYGAASFLDKNVGVGKTVNVTGITVVGADAGNYTFNNTAVTVANITVLPITVTAVTDTKVYDTTTHSSAIPAIVPSLVGIDTPNFIETFNTPTAGMGKILTPSGSVNDGNGGNNYLVTFVADNTGVINQATPIITWANPFDIEWSVFLSATQLNATASVPGIFTYTPALGAFLNIGNNQTLSVSFMPTDAIDYTIANKSVLINILNPLTGSGSPTSGGGSTQTQIQTASVLIPASAVKGKVLGAETFHFTLRLKRGSTGNEVLELQKFLNVAGYNCGTPDGKFGFKTKLEVIKFQVANKLKADGIVGISTRAVLNK